MAIFTKISGIWKQVSKVFVKVSGTWKEVQRVYNKISGTWRIAHSSAYNYTFTGNVANANLASILGSSVVNSYSTFNITINSGVTIYGTDGSQGADNTDLSATYTTNNTYPWGTFTRTCQTGAYSIDSNGDGVADTYYPETTISINGPYYFNGNGGSGTSGQPALNLSGMSGKTINIINNGTIRGGNGGASGKGAAYTTNSSTSPSYYVYNGTGCLDAQTVVCGMSGSAGDGGAGIYNPNGNAINISGNSPINGSSGAMRYGYYGTVVPDTGNCCCCCCGGCMMMM